jgi:hypothetical protein
MTTVEGQGYARWGLHGMLAIDAAVSVVMGVALLSVFAIIDRRGHMNAATNA